MRFHHELVYPADPGDVFAMLVDPAFREEVCEHQQVVSYSVSVEEHGDGTHVYVDQVQSLRGIAESVRRFVGEEVEIEQRETWGSTTRADLDVQIPGKPGRLRGAITLSVRDGRTVETVSGDIRVSVPLVGRKVEEMVARVFTFALEAEHAVGERWLTGA